MAIQFDAETRRIILDSDTVTSEQCWQAWVMWVQDGDNLKYLPALSQVGGDTLSGGRLIPNYFFLENGWRIKPMEADQELNFIGNMETREGDSPFAPTDGIYRVQIRQTVPVMAQGMASNNALSVTPAQVAEALFSKAVEGDLTLVELLRVQLAVYAGIVQGAGTSIERFKSLDGETDRLIVQADEFGNRSSVIINGA